MDKMKLQRRNRRLVNTDPQRRCYNGCHFSSKLVWGGWQTLERDVPPEKIKEKLVFWKDLNQIAINGRGEEARSEFRIIPEQ